MLNRWFGPLLLSFMTIVFILMLSTSPAFSATLSFETQGNARRDGLLTGELVYSEKALQEAIRGLELEKPKSQQGATAPIPLSKLEGAMFKMTYTSPYSGLEHTEKTLCGKEVYDINGYEETPLSGNSEPLLVLSGVGIPEYIDFSSCISSVGNVNTSLSKRDSRVAISTVDSLFSQLTIFDKDASGGVLFRKVKPIKFTFKR
ncbi:MAG: hypothetical protein AAF703_17615 [Cyanobacteria bacterium P01_D01_bin.105]